MTNDYIYELHRFLYASNDSNPENLSRRLETHLGFIPNQKLYRYRRCSNLEFNALQDQKIWLADPESYLDYFDSTIMLQSYEALQNDYADALFYESIHRALIETLSPEEYAPSKSELISLVEATKQTHTPESARAKCIELFGIERYLESQQATELFCRALEKRLKPLMDIFESLRTHPRRNLATVSLTTRFDNRGLWENYAGNYTGFCVEYDFSPPLASFDLHDAWTLLHIFPVMYYDQQPKLDHKQIVENIACADLDGVDYTLKNTDTLYQYCKLILSKNSDYQYEQEWRLIQSAEKRGLYDFPYVSRIFLGKDISEENFEHLLNIGQTLGVPVLFQALNRDKTSYEYIPILESV